MNYQRIYNEIVERGKTRKLTSYKEKHHIIPRCMGGTDESENIVELTATEHFICHKLLTEIYPNENGLHYASWMMITMKDVLGRDYRVGSREYQRLRENIIVSEETKQKISQIRIERGIGKGESNGMYGKTHTSEARRIQSEKARGYTHTEDAKRRMSESHIGMSPSNKGMPTSDVVKKKISDALQGRVPWNKGIPMTDDIKDKIRKTVNENQYRHSPEIIQKISDRMSGENNPMFGHVYTKAEREKLSNSATGLKRKIIECPHCGKRGGSNGMTRYHFDNCKYKNKL